MNLTQVEVGQIKYSKKTSTSRKVALVFIWSARAEMQLTFSPK
jgi:hypothetical protein